MLDTSYFNIGACFVGLYEVVDVFDAKKLFLDKGRDFVLQADLLPGCVNFIFDCLG